ncbi:MAG: hypothetical protein MJA31_15325 [Clostridia bacterium]|nr:hypothetical protein [Clostridia bacterium]
MKEFVKSDNGKILYWIIGIIATIVFAFILIPSLFSTINKIEPLIVGVPYLIFMEFLLGMILAALLVLLYWVQKVRGEL